MEQIFDLLSEENKQIASEIMKEMQRFLSGENSFRTFPEWKGYRFIPGFSPEAAQRAYENMSVKKGDVFVITYPKTGTNWTGEVVRQIMYGHDEKLDVVSKSLPPPMILIEVGNAKKYQLLEELPLPRKMYASHLPEELVNVERIKRSKGKIIMVIRNPKDQAVSWFHFTKNRPFDVVRDEFSSDWAQFLSDYTQGKHRTISKEGQWYPDHLLGWWKHKDDEDFLFLHFEDMKKDLSKEIRRIAKFLDVELSDERVQKIAESTNFNAMKKSTAMKNTEAAKTHVAMNLLRKGQVGGWKETFTVAQSEMMDKLIEEKLGHTGIQFTYEL